MNNKTKKCTKMAIVPAVAAFGNRPCFSSASLEAPSLGSARPPSKGGVRGHRRLGEGAQRGSLSVLKKTVFVFLCEER